MGNSPDRRSLTRSWQLALLAGLVIFAGRCALVFYAGSPVPLHDQWIAEATHILIHDAHHTLTWHNFVVLNGDHLIVTTQLIGWALYRLTGRWDMLAEMVINNAIVALAFGVLLHHLLRQVSGIAAALSILAVTVWLASPLFYGNCLWGFQSQIELLVLTAVVQIVATATMESIGWRWWVAAAASVLGFFSFGSALLAPLTCLLICALRARDRSLTRSALAGAVVANLVMLACGVVLVFHSPSFGSGGPRVANIVHTALHAFSWPAMQPSAFGLLLWLPLLVASGCFIWRRLPSWLATYALAVWTALQIVGIAVTRSAPAAALAPRYYDIFAVGVIANGALCVALLGLAKGRPIFRVAVVMLAIAWGGGVGLKGWQFARSHAIHDVPTMRAIARGQIDALNRYYAGEGVAALRAVPFPMRPYPEAEFLVDLLDDPTIKRALPSFLTQSNHPEPPRELTAYAWPGDHGPLRATWLWSSLALGALALIGYVILAIRPPPDFSRPTKAPESCVPA